MDFFQQQERARKNTKWLVVYFALAVAGIILSVYLASLLLVTGIHSRHSRYNYDSDPNQAQLTVWQPQLFLGVVAGVLAVVGFGSAYKMSALSSGGSAVAESLGGRLISAGTTDPNERKLLNVVEEMSIASGVPMPQVYVMDDEHGLNAFAAGHTTSDAAVSVTRGCIESLTRDELQGVIGHEFSHILNGDMRLNLRLMGVIFGIICLTVIGRVLLQVRSSGRNQNPLPLFGLVLIVVGGVGAFFANLIQAAVSRQREFLADASSVQFTRNPLGLSGALQKIGGSSLGSELESAHAHEACHMFFANGLKSSFVHAFDTHPPIEERIKAIDPSWDGRFKTVVPVVEAEFAALTARRKATPPPLSTLFGGLAGASALSGGNATTWSEPIWQKPPPIRTDTVLPSLGNPTPLHLRYAEQLRDAIPDEVKAATRDPLGAVALIYALLLDEDATLRRTQLDELTRRFPAVQPKVVALAPTIAAVAAHARLPLVNLALPALRELRPDEFKQFSETLTWLIESDRQIDLFEFVLQKIIQRHLEPSFGETRRAVVQFYAIKPLLPDCAVLLSALARVGSSVDSEIATAFSQGVPYLRSVDGGISLLSRDACGLDNVDAALNRLVQAAPQLKKNVIEACIHVAAADGVMQEHEAELLRAFADTLDCPIPPFVTAG